MRGWSAIFILFLFNAAGISSAAAAALRVGLRPRQTDPPNVNDSDNSDSSDSSGGLGGSSSQSNSGNLQPISDSMLAMVSARANESSHLSWELGTMAEAYLELNWPWMSVYGDQGVTPPRSATGTNNISSVLAVADYTIAIRPADILGLFSDSSVGDPPSIGVAMLLANWTKSSRPDAAWNDYNTPLLSQMHYLIDLAPRTGDGAISHRSEQVQLWSDFIYMVPPFLSYYGALAQPSTNIWLLQQSYSQIQLYRNYLHDDTTGLWRHVVLGDWQDTGFWATGNGWVAAGILRTLVTINQAWTGGELDLLVAQRNLLNWATDLVNNIWVYQQSSGALRNYVDNAASFEDASSTALLAASTFRIAAIDTYLRGPKASSSLDTSSVPAKQILYPTSVLAAGKARNYIINNLDVNTGWLQNVVDPNNFSTQGMNSPEGQSFVLLMESAWRDYVATL